MLVAFTKKSSNKKIGAIPCTVSSRETCPDNCPLKKNGCYADDYFTAMHWNKVTAGIRGKDHKSLCDDIRALPDGQLWRHNISGDLSGKNNCIRENELMELVDANQGKRGYTYTHKPLTQKNVSIINYANTCGFTINISANNINHADKIRAKFPDMPIAVIVPMDALDNFKTPDGNKIVVCPAVIKNNVSCQTCKLCAIPDREIMIGFPVHGGGKNKAILSTNNGNNK